MQKVLVIFISLIVMISIGQAYSIQEIIDIRVKNEISDARTKAKECKAFEKQIKREGITLQTYDVETMEGINYRQDFIVNILVFMEQCATDKEKKSQSYKDTIKEMKDALQISIKKKKVLKIKLAKQELDNSMQRFSLFGYTIEFRITKDKEETSDVLHTKNSGTAKISLEDLKAIDAGQ